MRFERLAIDSSIPDLFEEQVHRRGKRLAIVTEDGCVTYEELNQLANRIAGALVANGHRHGQTVGILIEQGILQIAAILGSLKAGGIYVPLDLALGRRRLHEIVQHADSHVVLTDSINQSTAKLIIDGHRRVLNVEEDLERYPDKYSATDRSLKDFAYIYYTSGTTGDPKGVVDSDRNVLHNISRYTTSLNIDCNDRLTLLQSCGFSGAVSNIFAALLNGALLLPFDVRLRGVSALAKWLALQEPTIFHSVPSLFRQLMRYCDTLPTLRVIRLEGDLARATLVNGLGATETGITAQYFFEHGDSVPKAGVPVGKPTHDICIDVVDANNQSLGRGHCGEIVITSRYLASGYWRRPDLTQLAFSPADGEKRSYRTGDLGRIDREGLLEVHGRMDSLARVHGQWVDLSALEAALAGCVGVSDSICAVSLSGADEPELTAWVVPVAGATVTSTSLREALRTQSWHGHSVPKNFCILERWPLDINGKVDRNALPVTKEPQKNRTVPETSLEKLVTEVYEQILGVSPISRSDDFFELGGDSLKAVEACLELNRRTGSNSALGAIQHAPVVMELARILGGEVNRGCLVPLQPRGDGPALFCVHAHMGHVFNLRNLALQLAPEQIVFGPQRIFLTYVECNRRAPT
jgi:amino acid adenylation domain-containing protein